MNKLLLTLTILLALTACRRSHFDSEYLKMEHDGETRTYLLHVPDGYDPEITTPLVIALHGGTGSAKNLEEQSGLPALSDEKGFILCSPNGVKRTWNAGECCGKAQERNVDDVGFINALIDELANEYSIDQQRIYVTGMSNGAMMSYRLACELSDRITAIAPVAGTMVYDCDPSEPVGVMHFHSYQDSNVPWFGGVGDGLSDHYNPPLDSVIQFWALNNNCLSYQRDSLETHDHYSWGGCDDVANVHLYITRDGGHSWPMGTKPRSKADEPSQAIDANELMWEFFESQVNE